MISRVLKFVLLGFTLLCLHVPYFFPLNVNSAAKMVVFDSDFVISVQTFIRHENYQIQIHIQGQTSSLHYYHTLEQEMATIGRKRIIIQYPWRRLGPFY